MILMYSLDFSILSSTLYTALRFTYFCKSFHVSLLYSEILETNLKLLSKSVSFLVLCFFGWYYK